MNAHQRRVRRRRFLRSYVPSGVIVSEIDRSEPIVNDRQTKSMAFTGIGPLPIHDLQQLKHELGMVYRAMVDQHKYSDGFARKYTEYAMAGVLRRTVFDVKTTVICDETNNPPSVVDTNDLVVDVLVQLLDGSEKRFHYDKAMLRQ